MPETYVLCNDWRNKTAICAPHFCPRNFTATACSKSEKIKV